MMSNTTIASTTATIGEGDNPSVFDTSESPHDLTSAGRAE
jgi:hypothetical protein